MDPSQEAGGQQQPSAEDQLLLQQQQQQDFLNQHHMQQMLEAAAQQHIYDQQQYLLHMHQLQQQQQPPPGQVEGHADMLGDPQLLFQQQFQLHQQQILQNQQPEQQQQQQSAVQGHAEQQKQPDHHQQAPQHIEPASLMPTLGEPPQQPDPRALGGPQAPAMAARPAGLPTMPSRPIPTSQMFQIFDRRINFNLLPHDASLYSMLRAWVQDDPFRQHAGQARPMDDMSVPLPKPAPETATTLLRLGPKRKNSRTQSKCALNTMVTVPSETLLELHVTYMKQVRRGLHKARARRYQRFKSRIHALGIPINMQLEKALVADDASIGGMGGDAKSVASSNNDDSSLSGQHLGGL